MSGSLRQPLGRDVESGRNAKDSDDFPREIFRLGWPYSVSALLSGILMPSESLNGSLFSKGGDLVVKQVTAWRMESVHEVAGKE
jgi:hypothetical protein